MSPAVDVAFADALAKGSMMGVMLGQGQMIDWKDMDIHAVFPALLQILDDLWTASQTFSCTTIVRERQSFKLRSRICILAYTVSEGNLRPHVQYLFGNRSKAGAAFGRAFDRVPPSNDVDTM